MRAGKFVLFKQWLLHKNTQEKTIIKKNLFGDYIEMDMMVRERGLLCIKTGIINGYIFI